MARPAIQLPRSSSSIAATPKPKHACAAFSTALQFEHLALRVADHVYATHPQPADELAEYTNQMLRCFRRSTNCVDPKKAQQESIQAAVWMVEALIILEDLKDEAVERPLITAAIEMLERTEDAMRAEGLLPPARD